MPLLINVYICMIMGE